ncbi:MAG TPA: DsbC family protein [Casimicrobiaceae bacterium]|jgi:thiol:disulfide interchange protein DsbC
MRTILCPILRNLSAAGFFLAIALPASAQDATKSDAAAKDVAAVRQALEAKFPGAPISNVSRSPYFGLYEAQLDDRMLYTDGKVNFVIVGSVYDTATRTNLTEQRMKRMNRVAWDSLPLELAIKKVKGDGSRKLAIFSDADCPYCKRLEAEMKGLDNVTIYTFLFPIDQLHPDSAHKSAMIWCSPDRIKAWDEWFDTGKLPDNKGDCATPIAQTALLGQKYHVNATPTLVFADGSITPGALPLDRIEAEMKQAAAEIKKLPAARK